MLQKYFTLYFFFVFFLFFHFNNTVHRKLFLIHCTPVTKKTPLFNKIEAHQSGTYHMSIEGQSVPIFISLLETRSNRKNRFVRFIIITIMLRQKLYGTGT